MNEQIVLIVLLIPVAWSALVAGLRRVAGNPKPHDRGEKYQLLITIAPVLLGALWLSLAPLVSLHLTLPMPMLDDSAPDGQSVTLTTAPSTVKAAFDPRPWLIGTVLAAWGFGVLVRATPLAASMVRLSHIAARAEYGDIAGVRVRLTKARLPPLALGRATILLPEALVAELAPQELRLIIRHEQAHLDRKDPFYFAVLSGLDALLWFNPFLRAQTRRCRLAAEMACDAAASGRNARERAAYAKVLIRTLKHTAGTVRQHAPAAISNVKSGDYRMRLSEIMHAAPAARKPKRWRLYAALAAALVPVAALQFAWAQQAAPPAAAPPDVAPPTSMPAATAPAFTPPVDGPISLAFGMEFDPVKGKTRFHEGVDFPVPIGTPVRAMSDGKVSAVSEKWGYGKIVEIDHGNGLMTRLAHLDSQKVAVGDTVKAGEVVATSGNSGGAGGTVGPHLHFEVWKDGRPQNPATILGLKVSTADDITLRAPRIHAVGDVVTGEGGAELRLPRQTVRADYIQWNRATGKTEARGHVTVIQPNGQVTAGGRWRPSPAGGVVHADQYTIMLPTGAMPKPSVPHTIRIAG